LRELAGEEGIKPSIATRTRNVGVNRMLDKWVPVAETRHVADPDGLALPGEFHIRYVRRDDVQKFLTKALP
jgi:hypothetical protein